MDFNFSYDAAGNLVRLEQESQSANPPHRLFHYNSFNKPKTIETIANGQTLRLDFDYNGNGERIGKAVQSRINNAARHSKAAEGKTRGSHFWDLSPIPGAEADSNYVLNSATFYFGDKFEKRTTDGDSWWS